MSSNTPNYSFILPGVNNPADQDLWGGYLNQNFSSIDTLLKTTQNSIVANRAYVEIATYFTTTAIIPLDNTKPQVTEGVSLLTASFTPSSATARVRVRFQCQFSTDIAVRSGVFAIFDGQGTDSIAAQSVTNNAGLGLSMVNFEREYVPGVATALTYSVRVGRSSTDYVLAVNGTSVGVLGGAEAATLIIEELKA